MVQPSSSSPSNHQPLSRKRQLRDNDSDLDARVRAVAHGKPALPTVSERRALVMPPLVSATPGPSLAELNEFEEAKRLFEKGEREKALRLIDNVLSNPSCRDDILALNLKSEILYSLDKKKECLSTVQKCWVVVSNAPLFTSAPTLIKDTEALTTTTILGLTEEELSSSGPEFAHKLR